MVGALRATPATPARVEQKWEHFEFTASNATVPHAVFTTPPTLHEHKCYTFANQKVQLGHGTPQGGAKASTTEGHIIAFGGTEERLRWENVGASRSALIARAKARRKKVIAGPDRMIQKTIKSLFQRDAAPSEHRNVSVIDLFASIGGFSTGCVAAGHNLLSLRVSSLFTPRERGGVPDVGHPSDGCHCSAGK
jgi:hypothetical protein